MPDLPAATEKGGPSTVRGRDLATTAISRNGFGRHSAVAPGDRTETLVWEYPRGSDEPLSHRIGRLGAIATDQLVTELEPLGHAIDVDALDALFAPTRSKRAERSVGPALRYEGYRLDIEADGTVRLLVEPD